MNERRDSRILGGLILLVGLGICRPAGAEPEPFEVPKTFTAVVPLMDMNGLDRDNLHAAALQPGFSPDSALAQAAGTPQNLEALMTGSGMAFAESTTPLEVGHFHVALTTSLAVGAAARGDKTHLRRYLSVILSMVETLGYSRAEIERVKELAEAGKYHEVFDTLTDAVAKRSLALMVPWTLGAFCGATLAGVVYDLPPMLRVGRKSIDGALAYLDEDTLKTPFAGLAQDLVKLTSGKSIDQAAVLAAFQTRYKSMGLSL